MELPAPEVGESGKEVTRIGEKWADLQETKFGKVTQPQYILLDHNGEMLNEDASYATHKDPEDFREWLKEGEQK